jgi:parallel beta-helix repeat protein
LIESENLPSNYNSISGNTIANNTHGIDIYYSHNSTVSGNTITNSTYGIFLLGSGNGTFSGNTVTNSTYGIYLSMSSNNIIYHNNFIDNSQQVSINPSGYTNVWDDGYPSGGNYWSDYTGMDLYWGLYQNKTGSDGIGDTPYVIDGNNRDNYPLISPYEYWSSPILGDINKDMKVDSDDLSQISLVYGSTAENPDWNPNCDINGDDKVDVLDLFKLGKNYGETAEAIGTNVARASSIAVFLHPFTVLPMLTVVCKGRKISRKFKSITRRMRAHGILTQIYQQKRCSTRSLRQNSWD